VSTIYFGASFPGKTWNLLPEQAYTQVENKLVGFADPRGGFHSEAGLNALLLINLAILRI